MKSCLVLIDAQESFRHRPFFTERDLGPYLAAQNALIEACQQHGVPIVRVFHVAGPKAASNPFALERRQRTWRASAPTRSCGGPGINSGWAASHRARPRAA